MEMAIRKKIQFYLLITLAVVIVCDDRIKLDLFAPRELLSIFWFKILFFYWFNTEEDG